MIVADRKPFEEIKQLLEPYRSVLVLGCGTCVSVCMAGGEREVALLASQLRMAAKKEGRELEVGEATLTRQCDREYIEPIRETAERYEVILSMACGAGVQLVAEVMEPKVVLPACNTRFIGVAEGEGIWSERCMACGDCLLAYTGGICPVAMCAKSLLNGPCGGTNHGKCEVSPDKDCAWTLIYRRLEAQGRLDAIRRIFPPRRFSLRLHPARRVVEEYQRPRIEGNRRPGAAQ